MELYPEELEIAERIGRKHAHKGSAIVQADEMTARLYLWLCDNFKTVERYRSEHKGLGKLHNALLHESYRQEAEEAKAVWLRDEKHDGSFSTAALIKHLRSLDDAEAGEVVAIVRGAFYSLSDEAQTLLRASYVTKTRTRAIAATQGRTVGAVRKSRHLALGKLKQRLTGSLTVDTLPTNLNHFRDSVTPIIDIEDGERIGEHI